MEPDAPAPRASAIVPSNNEEATLLLVPASLVRQAAACSGSLRSRRYGGDGRLRGVQSPSDDQ